MSSQSLIDAFDFAAAGMIQKGELPWRKLPRLRDAVRAQGDGLQYVARGRCDAQGRSWLHLEAQGSFGFVCQRCLEPMTLPWQASWALELARTQAEVDAAPEDPEAPDRILADAPLGLAELIEDEGLLSVPYAPRHDVCTARNAVGVSDDRASPFAQLRAMLDGNATVQAGSRKLDRGRS